MVKKIDQIQKFIKVHELIIICKAYTICKIQHDFEFWLIKNFDSMFNYPTDALQKQ